jgi:hypothetical protein
MSYILEALKKFEQKREQRDLAKSLMFFGAAGPESRKRPFWPYLLVVALLLNAGIMIWWIGPWRSDKKEIAAKLSSVQPSGTAIVKKDDRNASRPIGGLKEVQPVKDLLPSPNPGAGKALQSNSSAPSPKPLSKERISGISPVLEKGDSRPLPKPPPSAQSQSGSTISGQAEKKVIYFKDGTSETCEAFRVTENFIHCTQKGGVSIINLNKIDQEKTLSGNSP